MWAAESAFEALVETTLVPPGCSARLDQFNNILIRIEA
jgi:hypothetical protein